MELVNSGITMVKDLDVSVEDVILKVRVIRMWRNPDNQNKNEDYSIEMILIDEEGTIIYGNVLRKWFFRFEQFLKLNACLLIKKPSLGNYTARNKYVDHRYRLCLNYQTHISKCVDFEGPEYGFQFSSFRAILDKQISEFLTLDVIGHVTNIFTEEKRKPDDQKKRLTMNIEDLEGNTVFLTLWDTYAHQFEKYVSDNPNEEHVIVILQLAKVKWYGKPYVQNFYGGLVSTLFINNDIDDIRKYRKR